MSSVPVTPYLPPQQPSHKRHSCFEWLLVWYRYSQYAEEQLKFHKLNSSDRLVFGRLAFGLFTIEDYNLENYLNLIKIWQLAIDHEMPEFIRSHRRDVVSIILRDHVGENAMSSDAQNFANHMRDLGVDKQVRAYLDCDVPIEDIIGEWRFL